MSLLLLVSVEYVARLASTLREIVELKEKEAEAVIFVKAPVRQMRLTLPQIQARWK
jgi:hypothetical protein